MNVDPARSQTFRQPCARVLPAILLLIIVFLLKLVFRLIFAPLLRVALFDGGCVSATRGSSRAGYGFAQSYAIFRDITCTAECWVMVVLFFLAICSTLGIHSMLAACFFPSGIAVLSSIGGGRWGNMPLSLGVLIAFLFGAGLMPLCIGTIEDYFSLGTGFSTIGVFSVLFGALALGGLAVTRTGLVEEHA